MRSVAAPGQRRREVSAADRFGASFIHPSYGTIAAPAAIAAGAPLELQLVARDREGDPRAGARGRADARVPGSARRDRSAAVAARLGAHGGAARRSSSPIARPTATGGPPLRFESVPRGVYRIEVTVDGELVRPAPVVRAGDAPLAARRGLALGGRDAAAAGRGRARDRALHAAAVDAPEARPVRRARRARARGGRRAVRRRRARAAPVDARRRRNRRWPRESTSCA